MLYLNELYSHNICFYEIEYGAISPIIATISPHYNTPRYNGTPIDEWESNVKISLLERLTYVQW